MPREPPAVSYPLDPTRPEPIRSRALCQSTAVRPARRRQATTSAIPTATPASASGDGSGMAVTPIWTVKKSAVGPVPQVELYVPGVKPRPKIVVLAYVFVADSGDPDTEPWGTREKPAVGVIPKRSPDPLVAPKLVVPGPNELGSLMDE
ncbi:MAG: hypothetical protein AB7I30_04445 [Isosphaeraceae bacterium]